MSAELREMINFHLTGKRAGDAAVQWQTAGIVPAVLAPYRDLSALRYDYPLVLIDGPDTEAYVDTLSGIVNRLLRDIAPQGNAGEQLRQHVLRLERRMRELASGGPPVALAELWSRAEQSVLAECGEAETEWLGNSIATARFGLRAAGQVVDCDAHLPPRLFAHAWQKLGHRRQSFAKKINRLIIKLQDILKVDELKSNAAHTPDKLKSTLGKRYKESFDFERLAALLDIATPHNVLPSGRKARVQRALSTLRSQRFFATPGNEDLHEFVFDHLSAALKAYNERLEEVCEVVKAVEIAELEVGNSYRDDKHDSYFDRFGTQALTPEDLALFPTYLVCLHESECNTRDLARLVEIVTCDMPIKVLIQVSNALGEPSPVDGMPHRGSFVQQLVHTFIAGDAYVLQAPASTLYRQREAIRRGFEYDGPAIFSVFVPFPASHPALAPYLVSAAALESRVFPAFSYDPGAGPGLAERFDISSNPDVESDWPLRELRYEDDELQSVTETVPFTPADFAVLDPAYSGHFVTAPRNSWDRELAGVASRIEDADGRPVDAVPHVPVVGADDVLQRLAVDDKLIRIGRRCRERWHALQELGGIHSSYARATTDQAAPAVTAEPAPAPDHDAGEPVQAQPEAAPAAAPAASIPADDDPFIETPRCTTCDECTKRNDRMFAYDDNRQAFIKDPDAGTYRDLVEAAENCQVAIIHPGKPRNPDEAGLDELIVRAEPFI